MAVGFEEGSLWAWIKTNAQVLALIAPLLGAPLIHQSLDDLYRHHQQTAAQQAAIKQATPVNGFVPVYSVGGIREAGEDAFNYEAQGLSPRERRYRIALTQLALRIALQTHLETDGVLGAETTEHMKEFARRRNVPASIRSRLFRAELLKVLAPANS